MNETHVNAGSNGAPASYTCTAQQQFLHSIDNIVLNFELVWSSIMEQDVYITTHKVRRV